MKIKVVSKGVAVFFEGDDLNVIDRSVGGSSEKLVIVRNILESSDGGIKSQNRKLTIAVFKEWAYWQKIEETEKDPLDRLVDWKPDKKQAESIKKMREFDKKERTC